jgi:hypothetical protein
LSAFFFFYLAYFLQIEEITDCLVFSANALNYKWKGG